jgi:hypothetical protein
MCYKKIIREYHASRNTIELTANTSTSQQWCNWAFPKGEYVELPKTPNLLAFNGYGGFNLQADRLAFIDGSKNNTNFFYQVHID